MEALRQQPTDLLSLKRGRAVLAARLLLGGLFFFSGVEKVLDARSFLSALQVYPLPQWIIPFGALVPPLELVVGTTLVLGIASRHAAKVSFAMLIGFCLVVISGMVSGGLGSCGCFGKLLESSPGWALVRNAVLMVLALVIASYDGKEGLGILQWKVSLVSGLLLVSGIITGYTTKTPLADRSLTRVGQPFASEGYRSKAPTLENEQLVFVFTVSCHPCWNAMANVNQLAAEKTLNLFAVTASSTQEIEWLERNFNPGFPIFGFEPTLFGEVFRYWPALYYVVDGRIVGKLEGDIPTLKTLTDVHLEDWKSR